MNRVSPCIMSFAMMCNILLLGIGIIMLPSSGAASSLSEDALSTSSSSSSAFSLPPRSELLSTIILLNNNNEMQDDATHRNLQSDGNEKFATLNRLFAQVSLKLPPAKVSKSGLDLTITNLICRNLSVRDILLTHTLQSSTSQNLNVNIQGLKINCTFRWEYEWTFFNGGGAGSAALDPASSASADLRFASGDYDEAPPRDASVPGCDADVRIADMDFDGDGLGIIAGIIGLFEGLIAGVVEDELGGTVCSELRGLGDDALDDLLIALSDEMDAYLRPLEGSLADPLFLENGAEQQLPVIENGEDGRPDEPLYLDFRQLEDFAGDWVGAALDQVASFLGPSDSDPNGRLGINKFIRENFLTDDGKLTVDPSLFFDSGVVFDGHDMLTETTMSIRSIRLEGLDSFMEMDVLNAIGKHTLRNKLELEFLYVEVEMEAEMKASSKDDAIIVAPNAPAIKEKFTVSMRITGIEIDASIFLGINTETLGNLEIGSILHTDNILPCLLSVVDVAQFTGLSVTVDDMVPPNLSGFLDSGIDHLISKGAEALFHMYEKVLIKAMPNFFETYVRDMANDFIEDSLAVYRCPSNEDVSSERFVDFRDMFLPSTEAALLGGSGDGRYGNIIPWVMDIVEDQIFSANGEDGLLAINDMLIGPLTKSQSGEEGALKLNGTLVDLNKETVTLDIWKAFADNLRLTLSDLSITGLDTLRSPIKLLKARSPSAHLVENQLNLGIPSKPLDVGVRFGIEIGGAGTSPLAMKNILDLNLSMPSVEVMAVLFATIQESRLMNFPLKDVLNFNCWLSTMPVSDSSSTIDVGLAMHYLDVLFDEGIQATTACVSCSNTWLEDLSSVVEFLEENKFISGLKSRALAIARDLLEGDWVQGMVDKQIAAASQLCPHDAAFGSLVPDKAYSTFRGSHDLVDGIIYAGFPLVQVMAVAIAEKHSGLEIAAPVDVELNVPDGANLIDLTDLSSVAGWADMALDEARNYLGGIMDDGSWDLGITSMLRSLALNDNGLLTIPIDDQGFEAGGVKLLLYDVTMVGLDSFTMFDVLKASGPTTFGNSIKFKRLGVTVKMGLSVEDETSKQARMLLERGLNANEMETITASLILKDVDLDVSLLMAMDQDLMGEMKLGSIMDMNHIVSCLLSTIHSVGLSQFVMNIGDIEDFSISGFISEDTNKSIGSMTDAIFAEHKSTVLANIPAFTSNTVRPILHNILQVLVDQARDDGACPEPDSLGDIVDFRDLLLSQERALEMLGQGDSPYGDLFRMLYSFLEDMMSEAGENGLSKMNALVSSLTERQSNQGGELYYPGDLFYQDVDVALNGLNAAIELGVSDLRVSGLNSLGAPIKVLQPVEGESSMLNNTALIGVGQDPFRAEFRLLIKGKGDEVEVHNDLVLSLDLKSVGMMLEVLAHIKETPFMNFPLQDVLNLQCWLATVVTPVLDKYGLRVGEIDSGIMLKNLALAVEEAQLGIECISCSSPLIIEMASKLGSPESVKDTTDVANMIFDYASNLLGGEFVQSGLDKLLNEAAMKCPHSSSYNQNFAGLKYDELIAPQKDEDSYGFLIAIIAVIAVSVVLAALIFVITRCMTRRRHNRWVKTLNRTQLLELEKMQKEEGEKEKDLNSRMKSLVRSEDVPLFLRLFMPIVIVGNIALFLSGHLSLGGTVNVSGSFAGEDFFVDGFFEFSMLKSTIEMWNAGAKALAILIVIFSGVWPYTKQLFTLYIWFAPTRWLSSKRRGSILHWLDVLGKWSMVDVFVLLMTLASFRISVESPDTLDFLPDNLYSLDLLVRPLWGLYANMLAQLVAQVSSHVIIHYHRKTTMAAGHAQEVELGLAPSNSEETREKLCSHSFKLDYEASNKDAVVRRGVNWALSFALLSLMVLVILGCALPSFGIEVLGLVGLAVESGNEFEQAKTLYSVFDLASMIIDQAKFSGGASDYLGLGTLASLLVLTVVLVPLAQAASLLAQWYAPMTKKQRMRNTVLNEILSAWQYMEVYVASIVVAAWQLGGVSEYMINAYCDPLKDTFTSLSYYGILEANDAQCFRVDATVQAASWILVAASLILAILNHFIVGAASQKVQDDEMPAEQRLHSDRWLQSKQSTVTMGVEMSMDMSADEEEGWLELREVTISPVNPRFTDYYFFATARSRSQEQVGETASETFEVETAMLPVDENKSDE